MWLLWPSTPQAWSTRSAKPSSPGRPTWYITSSRRSSTIALRIRPPMSASASSQETSSNLPEPRSPTRRRGCRIRSGSWTWLIVAGPLAQLRPRRAGVGRVALELADLEVVVVDVGQQPAGRLAVEADRGDQHVVARLARLGVGLGVPVPLLRGRVVGEPPAGALPRQRDLRGGPLGVLLDGHDSGTSWPARTKTCSYISRATCATRPPSAPSHSPSTKKPPRARTAATTASPLLSRSVVP